MGLFDMFKNPLSPEATQAIVRKKAEALDKQMRDALINGVGVSNAMLNAYPALRPFDIKIVRDEVQDEYVGFITTRDGKRIERRITREDVRTLMPSGVRDPEPLLRQMLEQDAMSFLRKTQEEALRAKHEKERERKIRIAAVWRHQKQFWTPTKFHESFSCYDWIPGDPPLESGNPIAKITFITMPLDLPIHGGAMGKVIVREDPVIGHGLTVEYVPIQNVDVDSPESSDAGSGFPSMHFADALKYASARNP